MNRRIVSSHDRNPLKNDLDDQIHKSLKKLEDDLFQPNLILLGIRQFNQALWDFQRGVKEGKARQANQKTVIGPRGGRNTSSFFYQGRLTTRTCHSDGSDATAVDAIFDTDNQDPIIPSGIAALRDKSSTKMAAVRRGEGTIPKLGTRVTRSFLSSEKHRERL
ncbi:hypothetical protein C8J56DRAFT_1027676 [Mycena floridula]|nr:hypothetical protein C8J56DRAFT_1027676 [Mycena floridula]